MTNKRLLTDDFVCLIIRKPLGMRIFTIEKKIKKKNTFVSITSVPPTP